MNALQRLTKSGLELWSAVLALGLALLVGTVLIAAGTVHVRAPTLTGIVVGVFLGPALALAGAWLDVRRGQAIGLLFLVLAALLSLDGAIATYFAGLPVFALVLLSLAAGIARRRQAAGGSAPGG